MGTSAVFAAKCNKSESDCQAGKLIGGSGHGNQQHLRAFLLNMTHFCCIIFSVHSEVRVFVDFARIAVKAGDGGNG
ncbi:MAG: hypothetical protein ACUVTG_08435, partial [Candidatus Oleimicrobiaceae bacterium]